MMILLIQLSDENVPVYSMGLAYMVTALNDHNFRIISTVLKKNK